MADEQGLLSEDESWKVYKESGGRGIPPRTQVNSVAKAQIAELKTMGYVKWDREKVARYLFKKKNGFPNARFYPNWEDEVQACSLTGEEYLTIADQLKEILAEGEL